MPENDRYLGKTIHENNYHICKKIGYGGFGTVYLADHRFWEGKRMVIKFLENVNPLLSDEDKAEAFEKIREEGSILQKLRHRNILGVESVGIFEQRVPYLILDYAANGTLRQKMGPGAKPLSLEERLEIIEQAGEALQYMHKKKVVHGDVKPENILFDDMGTPLLSDMGSAAVLTAMQPSPRLIVGTFQYMAPEQFKGKVVRESDQYALGCIAYELLTGSRPVTVGGSEQQGEVLPSTVASEQVSWDQPPLQEELLLWERQHDQARPPRPGRYNSTLSLPTELAILKALAKKPEDRDHSRTGANCWAFDSCLRKQKPPRNGRSGH
ncbi:MAG TPA: serine/threonine-protein kinase [Ktedonobacteraceae bacterium]|nr:serine/threonine-protein kinase [Ktedonobacteraceae bacterium]